MGQQRTDAKAAPAALLAACALTVLVLAALFAPSAASAAQPALWKSCESRSGEPPTDGAGQCSIPRGIGVDPRVPGHLYVADQANDRVVELTAWGGFVRAWGWGVLDGSAELQACEGATGCQEGIRGSGAGQLALPQGIAVDSVGAVYVVNLSNRRVQKFSPEGELLLMFGGEVNKTTGANVCTAADLAGGDVCGAGVEGAEAGFFGAWPVSSFIAVDRKGTLETDEDDIVYVGDTDRIQEFDAEGAYLGEIELPEAGRVGSLAVNSRPGAEGGGDLYFTYPGQPEVLRLDPASGEVLDTLEAEDPGTGKLHEPTGLASDTSGNLYVFFAGIPGGVSSDSGVGATLAKFDPEGDFVEALAQNPRFNSSFPGSLFDASTGIATGSACLSEDADLYLANSNQSDSFVRAFGPPPDDPACPPERRAPSIEAAYATSVGTTEAQLEALVNPHFWSGAQGATRYFVQYATAACVEVEPGVFDWKAPCVAEHPAPPGLELKGGVVDRGLPAPVLLTGLDPGTDYRFRFAAESRVKDSEGEPTVDDQPVIGVGGTPGEEGAERAFRTFAERPGSPCPNDAFRTGPSAALPDCRAYELVSPVNKANGDIITQLPTGLQADLARHIQAAASGGALTYSSYRAFAGPEGAPYVSQYLARREPGGWSTENVSSRQEGPEFGGGFQAIGTLYRYFSPELAEGWIQTATDPVLAPGAQERRVNVYRRDSVSGSYEACTTAASLSPAPTDFREYLTVPQGVSTGGQVAVFRANDKLTDEASEATEVSEAGSQRIKQLYACVRKGGSERELQLASVLPAGMASDQGSTAGAGGNLDRYGRSATLANALSEDGSRLYWQTGGRLYLRENPAEPQSPQEHGSAQGKGALIGPAQGEGKTIKDFTTISEFVQKEGAFAVGQEVSGPCLKAGTKVTAVELQAGRLKITPGAALGGKECEGTEVVGHASDVVSNLSAGIGAFAPGQQIAGAGIALGTTVGALGPEGKSLTLSAPATQTGGGIGEGDLVGPALGEGQTSTASKTITQFKVKEAGFAVGQEVQGECLAAETKVTVLEIAAEKLQVNKNPTADCAGTEIAGIASDVIAKVSVAGGAFLPGEAIHAPGIPAGATITDRTDTTLTISEPVEAGGTGLDVEIEAAVALEAFSECTEPAKGCTYPVSPAGAAAAFGAARPDGAAALFTQGGALYRFEAASGEAEPIAAEVVGLAGASANLSRAYFASTSAEPGGAPVAANEEGDLPVAKGLNLYLHESGEGSGSIAFIGTLAAGEGGNRILSPIAGEPNYRLARVTPDGARLAFTTQARLTDYDNTDRISGSPAAEVYLYDADDAELLCPSCNPSGARPLARELKRSRFASTEEPTLAAAHIPPWMNSFHAPRALSDDGSRLYFNSTDALALGDINGHQDVYQWEQPGSGDCTTATDTYSAANGGCVELISSGRSGADSEFFDADHTGADVFFTTAQSLLPHDPGLIDVYDAREGGGLDPPPVPSPPCEGEACQSPPAAPEPITPASSLARGGGNVASPPARRRCSKGKVRRRGRCVKAHRKRAAKHRKRAQHHHRQRSAAR